MTIPGTTVLASTIAVIVGRHAVSDNHVMTMGSPAVYSTPNQVVQCRMRTGHHQVMRGLRAATRSFLMTSVNVPNMMDQHQSNESIGSQFICVIRCEERSQQISTENNELSMVAPHKQFLPKHIHCSPEGITFRTGTARNAVNITNKLSQQSKKRITIVLVVSQCQNGKQSCLCIS
jgi:hypothetical protein